MLAAVAAQRATAGPDSGPISEEEDRRTRAFERAEAKRMATDPSRPGIVRGPMQRCRVFFFRVSAPQCIDS